MITLTAAATRSTSIGGTTVDTATAAAVSGAMTNFANPSITIQVPYGTFAGGVFTASPYAEGQQLFLDLVAGTYRLGNGAPGAIPADLLAEILAVVKAYRNGLEMLANAAGAAPGTITVW